LSARAAHLIIRRELVPPVESSPEKKRLPLLGPPGHEHLPTLELGTPEEDVAQQEPTPVPPRVLRAARAVAEALFSSSDGPPDAARLEWVVGDFGDFLSRSNSRPRSVMRLCLFALTWLAPWFVFRPFVPLGWLSLPTRIRALERIEHTALGPAALAPKAILCILWFEHADTQRETNTIPTCLNAPDA
jgi:hypothetical protein